MIFTVWLFLLASPASPIVVVLVLGPSLGVASIWRTGAMIARSFRSPPDDFTIPKELPAQCLRRVGS